MIRKWGGGGKRRGLNTEKEKEEWIKERGKEEWKEF